MSRRRLNSMARNTPRITMAKIHGRVTVRDALTNSLNVATVKVAELMDARGNCGRWMLAQDHARDRHCLAYESAT